jgi:signal peptidase II
MSEAKPPAPAHRTLLASVVCAVGVIDQISKALVREHLALGERIPLVPGLVELVRVENRGIAWGLLSGHPLRLPLVSALSLVTFVVMLGWHRRLAAHERGLAWSLSLVLAGATGNFIDRLLYRQVTDFVELIAPGPLGRLTETALGASSWAVFNVADAAITLGLALFAGLALTGRATPPGVRHVGLGDRPASGEPAR